MPSWHVISSLSIFLMLFLCETCSLEDFECEYMKMVLMQSGASNNVSRRSQNACVFVSKLAHI